MSGRNLSGDPGVRPRPPRGAMRWRLLLHIRRTQGHTRTSRRAARDTTDRGTADLVGGERRDRIPFHAGDDHVWKHCGAHAEIWHWRRRHDVPRDLGVVLDVVDCHKAGPVQVACVEVIPDVLLLLRAAPETTPLRILFLIKLSLSLCLSLSLSPPPLSLRTRTCVALFTSTDANVV